MTGSRKWFVYTADNGVDYAIELDESNTEAVNGGTQDYTSATTSIIHAVPRNITPRKLFYSDPQGLRVIECVALTPTIYNGAYANVRTISDPYDTSQTPATLNLIRQRAEKIRLPRPDDTNLQDGDST